MWWRVFCLMLLQDCPLVLVKASCDRKYLSFTFSLGLISLARFGQSLETVEMSGTNFWVNWFYSRVLVLPVICLTFLFGLKLRDGYLFLFLACLIFRFVILLPVVLSHTYTPPDGYKICLYLGKCLIKMRMVMCVCGVVTLIYNLSVHN